MPDSEAKKAWIKANTTTIATKFNNRTDADILAVLEAADSKQGEIKRLLRIAIALEVQQASADDAKPFWEE